MSESDTLEQIIQDRSTLHHHPEEGWTEFFATWYVAHRLDSLGMPYHVGPSLVKPEAVLGRYPEKVAKAQQRALALGVPQAFLDRLQGVTGVVAELDTGRPGPVTACRFDIDCVCVNETTDPHHIPTQEGFASDHAGLMHACGHDAHTAVGLALAKWLMEHKDELNGRFKLIFQPAEEGTRGAYAMTEAGWVDDVDYFLGGHVGVSAKLGELQIATGGYLATSKIDISFTGVPSHAGADPEKGRSALLAAAAAALMISGIPRHSGGDSRVSVGTLYAGEGRNVTPVYAKMQVETRGITAEVNEFMEARVRDIVKGVAITYGVESSVTLAGKALSLPVCPELVKVALEVGKTVPGLTKVEEYNKTGGSEDCTFFMQRVVDHGGQAIFFHYGANHPGHHRADFDIQPQALLNGFEMFKSMLLKLNGR